ncbi:MAG: hypothetical protein GPJ54_06210 [Candidatus Heimdallarchaeota archaeon]|nr:hypothetical protein [Candidatus Heimdallarchaeota archaeon]
MIFTKDTQYDIKTNENSSTAYKRFFSGEFDDVKHNKSDEEKELERKEIRENLIKLIMERYPLDFKKDTNYNRYSEHEMNSIAQYGDHRAEIDPEFVDIDDSPTYHTNPKGQSVISHNTINLEYKDRHQKDIAIKLGGYGMYYSMRNSVSKNKETKHLSRMKNYKRLLKSLPIKFRKVTQFLLNEKIEELAKASMNYYSTNSKKFLTGVIIELMQSYEDVQVANVSVSELCQEFNIDTAGIINLRQDAVKRLSFLMNNSRRLDRRTLKRKQIKRTAQSMIFQLADQGFVCKPAILNEFVEEIDNHYSNIFCMKKKPEMVIAILAAKLFDEDLNTQQMAVALCNDGVSEEDIKNSDLLTKQVISWMRNTDGRIGNDIRSGRIRDLYVSEIEEILLTPDVTPEVTKEIVQEITNDIMVETSTVITTSRPGNPPRRTRKFTHNHFNDSIVNENDQGLLNYLIENNLLDPTSRTTSPYKTNSMMVETQVNHNYHWDQYPYAMMNNSPNHLNPDMGFGLAEKGRSDNTTDLGFSKDDGNNISKPGIDQDLYYINNNELIDYCYLGYPGAITRLLSWLSIRTQNKSRIRSNAISPDGILSQTPDLEGQNPSIVWMLDKKTFFERADQVIMKRNSLFGKWNDYIQQNNVKFIDDLNIEIDTIDQMFDVMQDIYQTGNLGNNESRLEEGSVILFPDLRRLLYNELESSVLLMAPNDFVRMKQDQYNLKITDLELASSEKIRAYKNSIDIESTNGIYQRMRKQEIVQMLADFTDAQNIRLTNTRNTMRRQMKSEIDEFINYKHQLGEYQNNTEEYREIQHSMFKYGVIMSDRVKYFYTHIRELINQIRERYGFTVIIGGILSKNIKTSQLIKDKTLHINGILGKDPDHIIDQHLIKLCYDFDENRFESASVVTTNIPDRLSISTYKLTDGQFTPNGLGDKWIVDRSIDVRNLVEWVN